MFVLPAQFFSKATDARLDMHWETVIRDPLGIAGFALSLVFALVTRTISRKRKEEHRWLVPAAYALAVVCVVGGFTLAWRRDSVERSGPLPANSVPTPSATVTQPAAQSSQTIVNGGVHQTINQTNTGGGAGVINNVTTGDINQSGDGNVAGVVGNVTTNVEHPQQKKSPAKK